MKQICIFILIFAWMISMAFGTSIKTEVVDAVKRNAVCNDGSPAVYYLEPGSGDGVKRWVIVLGAGGFCNSPGCGSGTSIDKPASYDVTAGILTADKTQNPDFYSANHVAIPYCSSDLWSGNKLDTQGHVQYRGRKIFRSVIRDLMNKTGSNLTEDGTEILLVGWSAGGIGVLVNLDWLAKQLPSAKVRGFDDGGWLPVEPTACAQIENAISQGITLWQGAPDQDCTRANRKNKAECYMSAVFPYLNTPLFIQESQHDPLVPHGWLPNRVKFSTAVRHSLIPVSGAFSARKVVHVLSQFDTFVTFTIDGSTLADVLGNWFFDRAGPVKIIKK